MRKLFSNIFPIICCLGLGFLISCSDKDPEPEPEQKLGLYLPIGSTTYNPQGEAYDSTRHIYNSEGKMIQLNRGFGNYISPPIDLIYDNGGKVIALNYAQNIIQQRDYNVQGQLTKIKYYDNLGDPSFKTKEEFFDYDASGKLIRINTFNYYNTTSSRRLNKFTYNSNGLITIDSSFIIGNDNVPIYNDFVEYEYDNKRGINEFGLGHVSYLYFSAPLTHNITSFKKTLGNSIIIENTFQYEYNEQDFPVKITALEKGKLLYNKRITYQYF